MLVHLFFSVATDYSTLYLRLPSEVLGSFLMEELNLLDKMCAPTSLDIDSGSSCTDSVFPEDGHVLQLRHDSGEGRCGGPHHGHWALEMKQGGRLHPCLVGRLRYHTIQDKLRCSGCHRLWCIFVCHPHLTLISHCLTAVWAQACGSEHKTSFVIILHHRFIWRPCLSFDPRWSVGVRSITTLPLLV